MYEVSSEYPELLITSIKLPHLSGTARGAIKNQFKILDKIGGATADNIAEVYAKEIISHIELLNKWRKLKIQQSRQNLIH